MKFWMDRLSFTAVGVGIEELRIGVMGLNIFDCDFARYYENIEAD